MEFVECSGTTSQLKVSGRRNRLRVAGKDEKVVSSFTFFNIVARMIDPTRLEHFRNLVSLSAADGSIKEIERVALSKIAYSNDIPLDRLNFMLSKASEYIYLIPQNTQERERQLEEMIQLAWVDGEFATAEMELIHLVGEKLGFTIPEVDNMISQRRSQ